MRLSPLLVVIVALLGAAVVLLLGAAILRPTRPLLADVYLSLNRITPNADGSDDVTEIRYTLSRSARLSITFTDDASGQIFAFREDEIRTANTYRVLFSGVVNGFSLPNENIGGQVERRLMPNGMYTWQIRAIDADSGEEMRESGKFEIADGDSLLPDIQSYDIVPRLFTPNQDGYDDRIAINLYLAKPARLTVYLEGTNGVPYYIAERQSPLDPNKGGAREFDYDGGVDNNIVPPPDGEYQVIAIAEDDEGQRVRRVEQITIKDGGLPQAEIVAQSTGRTVTWQSMPYNDSYFTDAATSGRKVELPSGVTSTQAQITLPQGDLLVFALTVRNYGVTPIRTIGPETGSVYQYDQTNAAMSDPTRRESISGAWRIGIECERSESSYPYRWAIGSPTDLTAVKRENETLYYLMPGQEATVWGAVRMTRLIPTRNPQKCYAALIHEDVAIPPRQNRVGEIDVRLLPAE